MLQWFVDSPLLTIFFCVGVGAVLGSIRFGPVSFGSAGALFVALALSAIEPDVAISPLITSLALCVFCYMVGVDIVHRHRTFAQTEGGGQRGTGGLVAHVGTVRQVVRAQAPTQQLEDIRGLIGSLARGVEHRLIRLDRFKLIRNDPEGLVPADRAVVAVTGLPVIEQWLGDAANLAQPVVRLLPEFLHGVGRPEIRASLLRRRLFRDGLSAVLAELHDVEIRLVRLRPRAAGAVETLVLVDGQQRRGRIVWDRVLHRVDHGRDAGGDGLRLADIRVIIPVRDRIHLG